MMRRLFVLRSTWAQSYDPEIYINRGITLDNLNRIGESMDSFDKALELDSSMKTHCSQRRDTGKNGAIHGS